MATKPFNTNYHIDTPEGFVLVNGDQITKIEALKRGDNWDLTLHLSDGSTQLVKANRFTNHLAQEIIAEIEDPSEESSE